MYNRYLNSDGYDNKRSFDPKQQSPEPSDPKTSEGRIGQTQPPSLLGGALKNLFGGNIRLPELNSDTLLLLVLVYFLVADNEKENINDTILIIAALFLLGL